VIFLQAGECIGQMQTEKAGRDYLVVQRDITVTLPEVMAGGFQEFRKEGVVSGCSSSWVKLFNRKLQSQAIKKEIKVRDSRHRGCWEINISARAELAWGTAKWGSIFN